MKWVTHNAKETIKLGKKIAAKLRPNDVLTLHGTLGSGKTTFVKGVAEALKIREPITSPTFTLLSQYEGKMLLTHMDLYRLGCEEEFELLGGEDFFYDDGITLIEWSEKAASFLPAHTTSLFFEIEEETQNRIISTEDKRFESVRL